MAAQTTTGPTTLTLDTALANLQTCVAVRDEAKRVSDEVFAKSSPWTLNEPSVSRGDYLRALAQHDDVERALKIAEADVEDAGRVVRRLRDEDRDRQRAALTLRLPPLVATLNRALDAAAAANAAVARLDQELAALGFHDFASWPELGTDTASFTPRLSCWRAAMRQRGLLDDIAG